MSPKLCAGGALRKESSEFRWRGLGVLPREGGSLARHKSVWSWRGGEGYSSLNLDF